jgi:hypothetical protein
MSMLFSTFRRQHSASDFVPGRMCKRSWAETENNALCDEVAAKEHFNKKLLGK